jgi:uncharacterized membrane protein YtjA (UPF0391 family)
MRFSSPSLGMHRALRINRRKEHNMLSWAVGFFILALIAAVFGFTGIAAGAAGIAKILFFAFLVIAAVSLLAGGLGRRGI